MLGLSFQSHAVYCCQHNLEEVIEFVRLSDEIVLRHNGFFIYQVHLINFNYIHKVNLAAIVTYFNLVVILKELLIVYPFT